MSNPTYSVTHGMLHTQFFSHVDGGFTANTRPTATDITTIIAEVAADLNGILGKLGITQPTSAEAQAFAWCQKTILLGTAAEVAMAMPLRASDAGKDWRERYEARLKKLEESPSILTDAVQPTDPTTGFGSAISDLSLDAGDSTDYSDEIKPAFRRDDEI